MEATLLRRLTDFCDINAGYAVALRPHAVPSRRAVIGTDCKVMVVKLNEEPGDLPVPSEREAGHAEAIIDSGADREWKPIDLSKVRRWAGPVSTPCICAGCNCDESKRSDPCLFGPLILNRHYLAMATRLLGGGEARMSFPRTPGEALLIDKGEWRVAIMPMTSSPTHPENDGDLPRFEL